MKPLTNKPFESGKRIGQMFIIPDECEPLFLFIDFIIVNDYKDVFRLHYRDKMSYKLYDV